MKDSSSINHHPPQWPIKILKLLLKNEYLEEIEGDLEEVFQDNVEFHSPSKARRKYIWDSVKLIRPSLIKNLSVNPYSSVGMFQNNLKVSFRILKRNKVYTFINVLGMSVGLAIAMLIMLYAQFELSYEEYNPKADRMVRVTLDYLSGETVIHQDCEVYPPMPPLMKAEFSEVEEFTRAYHNEEQTIQIEDEFFRESNIYGVDPAFFTLFNYPFIQGNQKGVFTKAYETVLTRSQAYKYFGEIDVVGESIKMAGVETPFKIVGVIEDCPANTHLKFNMLISYPTMNVEFGDSEDNWNGNNTYAYLLLNEKSNLTNFGLSMQAFTKRLIDEEKIWDENVVTQPVKDIHLNSKKSFEPEKNGDATSVYFLLGVALLVIIIAIVNYINLSTSRSLDRAKEVGIRKVLGTSMFQLRTQFLTESIIINVFAGVFSLILMVLTFSEFKNMAGLPKDFHFYGNGLFWLVLVSIIILNSLLSGIFPAFILSSFKPVSILKGRFSHSAKGTFMRKSLVIFQFAITIFLLIQTLTAEEQLRYMREKDLGLNIERTIVVTSPHDRDVVRKNHQTYKNELEKFPQFTSVATSSCVPGLPAHDMGTTTSVKLAGAKDNSFNYYILHMDAGFIPTMEIEVLAGRNFIENAERDDEVIINEETLRLWEIADPEEVIDKQLKFWGREVTIVGVIKNFHQASAKSAYLPMLFLPSTNGLAYTTIKTTAGDVNENLAMIEKVYEKNYPNSPFEYFFLDQEYDKQFRADEQFQQVFGTLTGFAILIACLGLFGLVSFTIAKRAKEIGVRKVLGAEVWQIILLLSKDFVSLVLFSMLIAIPLTFFIISNWLERYAFRIDLNVWLFVLPALAVLLVAAVTVVIETWKISRANPIKSLRSE